MPLPGGHLNWVLKKVMGRTMWIVLSTRKAFRQREWPVQRLWDSSIFSSSRKNSIREKQSEKERIEYKLRVVGVWVDYYTETNRQPWKLTFIMSEMENPWGILSHWVITQSWCDLLYYLFQILLISLTIIINK